WYARDKELMKYHPVFEFKTDPVGTGFNQLQLPDGNRRAMTAQERSGIHSLPAGARQFMLDNLTKPGPGAKYEIEVNGEIYNSGRRWWGTPKPSLEKLVELGRATPSGKTLRFI